MGQMSRVTQRAGVDKSVRPWAPMVGEVTESAQKGDAGLTVHAVNIRVATGRMKIWLAASRFVKTECKQVFSPKESGERWKHRGDEKQGGVRARGRQVGGGSRGPRKALSVQKQARHRGTGLTTHASLVRKLRCLHSRQTKQTLSPQVIPDVRNVLL